MIGGLVSVGEGWVDGRCCAVVARNSRTCRQTQTGLLFLVSASREGVAVVLGKDRADMPVTWGYLAQPRRRGLDSVSMAWWMAARPGLT